jgi:hypothetical protein
MNKKIIPVTAALAVAAIAVILYISSGRFSLDTQMRNLNNRGQDDTVKSISIENNKKITITCADGETYSIVFNESPSDYTELIFNSCGPAGGTI